MKITRYQVQDHTRNRIPNFIVIFSLIILAILINVVYLDNIDANLSKALFICKILYYS